MIQLIAFASATPLALIPRLLISTGYTHGMLIQLNPNAVAYIDMQASAMKLEDSPCFIVVQKANIKRAVDWIAAPYMRSRRRP